MELIGFALAVFVHYPWTFFFALACFGFGVGAGVYWMRWKLRNS